jgi:hypothetical protein
MHVAFVLSAIVMDCLQLFSDNKKCLLPSYKLGRDFSNTVHGHLGCLLSDHLLMLNQLRRISWTNNWQLSGKQLAS